MMMFSAYSVNKRLAFRYAFLILLLIATFGLAFYNLNIVVQGCLEKGKMSVADRRIVQERFYTLGVLGGTFVLISMLTGLYFIKVTSRGHGRLVEQIKTAESARKAAEEARELTERLTKFISQLQNIYKLGDALISKGGMQRQSEEVFHSLLRILNADSGSLLLLNENTNKLFFAATYGLSEREIGQEIELGERIAGWVAKNSQPQLLIDGLGKYPQFSHLKPRKEISSSLSVPLKLENRLIGVINLNRLVAASKPDFTKEDLNLLCIFVNHAALAVENARLLNSLEEANLSVKETQAQLIQSEKMTALGELTAGVAHELNQPLNVIKIIGQSVLRDMQRGGCEEGSLRQDLKEVVGQVNKMAEIIDHMRIFTRPTDGMSREMIDVNTVIKDMFKFAGQQLKDHNIEVIEKLTPDLPKVIGNPVRLEQVFLNLVTNARGSVESSGKKNRKIEIRTYKIGNQKAVAVEIEDNGAGIPSDLKEKIFQPFFTTREPGKGTGLGLSVTSEIVEEHNGKIELESKVGEGAMFRVILPTVNNEL